MRNNKLIVHHPTVGHVSPLIIENLLHSRIDLDHFHVVIATGGHARGLFKPALRRLRNLGNLLIRNIQYGFTDLVHDHLTLLVDAIFFNDLNYLRLG